MRRSRGPAPATNGGGGPARAVKVSPVRKAYEQVADQLRELIMSGELEQGERLPNEALLASEFAVSRATIREALRALAAQNLIRTVKGGGGGSYVTVPSVDHISEFVHANLNLLSDSRSVSLDELLEARELLEVPAARLAALRQKNGDVAALREAIPDDHERYDTADQFTYNADFHTAVIKICDNALLGIAAQPIFTLLQDEPGTLVARPRLSPRDQPPPPGDRRGDRSRRRRRCRARDARPSRLSAPLLRAGLALGRARRCTPVGEHARWAGPDPRSESFTADSSRFTTSISNICASPRRAARSLSWASPTQSAIWLRQSRLVRIDIARRTTPTPTGKEPSWSRR